MAEPADQSYGGRFPVAMEDGTEVVYYDPTEAVEEHAGADTPQKTLGGLSVDEGTPLEQDEDGKTGANSSGRVLAVPKRGQEEIFAQLNFAVVLPASASDPDEAMGHARRYLKKAGLRPSDFLSFNVTTHYYLAPLGKRECGWSFSFESKPFSVTPQLEQ